MKWAKKAWNNSTYDVTHKKPKQFFFIADAKTCRIFWGFEQLSSAIVSRDITTHKQVEAAGF